jgi:NAD(P)-dependent dehydrogenase (short-subunit alcohol dehydrogenase family)
VVAVCPGYVLTPMQEAEYTPQMMATVNARIPLGRHARPEEVAALFAFHIFWALFFVPLQFFVQLIVIFNFR